MGDTIERNDEALAFLNGGGEMGQRIREFDWSTTPLGPVEQWPSSLRSSLSICVNSNFPIALYWGSDLVLLYNDEWSPIPGKKHPWTLGRPAREAWPEIWHIIEPLFGRVMTTGEATRSRDQLLPMHRHGFTEECYFDYTFSPIRGEGGAVEGVFNAVLETTTRVIGERRLRTLRELGASKTGEPRTAEAACQLAAGVLAENLHDLPFSLVYLLDSSGCRANLAGMTGLEANMLVGPRVVDVDATDCPWPFRLVADSGLPIEVDDLPALFGNLPGGNWPESPQKAVVLPIAKSGQGQPAGFVVAGISPRLAFNDEYRGFLDLLTGHISAAIASARAYEEERRRAESLAELDRAKTTFFSNVSHEFRTPLTLMLGPIEDLMANPADQATADSQKLLAVVHRNGLRLQRLVNALLDFSRIEAGRIKATFEQTDLATFTADLASNFRSACEKAGLELKVDCPPLAELVFVDRLMWEKIVLNLVSNAFKFTFQGEIGVSMRQAGQSVELRVHDTGIGVSLEEMPRLFERFHRVENARGRTHEGSGIGLALVQELVKLHGGSIAAESEVGRGTTFTVTVPMGAAHLPPEQVVSTSSGGLSTSGANPFVEEALRWLPDADLDIGDEAGTIQVESEIAAVQPSVEDRPLVLVADDNGDMRRYVERLLTDRYRVDAVPDGAAALEAVQRQRPDLILSDVMMPRLDGFGLLRALRADPATATIPVVLLSARAGEESRVEGVEAGADDYLVKPFTARELLVRVAAQIQMAQMRRVASATLRESEERLRAFVSASSDVVYGMSADWSEMRFLRGQGFLTDTSEPSYSWLEKYIYRDDRQHIMEVVREAIRTKDVFEMEHRVIRADGTLGWTSSRAAPVLDADGEILEWFGGASDISARKQTELLQGGQRPVLEMIARGAPLPEVLPAVCRLIEEQELGLLCSILLTDDAGLHTGAGYGPSLPNAFVQALQGIDIRWPHVGSCCKALDFGQEVLVADIENDDRWSPLWRDLNLSYGLRACRSIPIFGSDGSVLASVAIFRRQVGDPGPANKQLLDIATHLAGIAIERRRAEDRERQLLIETATANAQFRAFFEQGALFAGIMHVDGTILEPNRLSLEACGYTRDQVVGKLFWDCPWWSPSPELSRQIKAASALAASGETFRAEMNYFVADGSQRTVDLIILPIKDPSGKVMFLAPTGTDVTERKTAVEGLKEADRRKDEFLATLAHELRNPLAPIRNGLQVLRLGGTTSEMADSARLMMERQLGQMVHLIDDLLDLSRISRGKIELRKQRVELAKIVQQAIETSRPAIEQAGHELIINVPTGPVYVDADVTRLAQVFSNLLNNAAKYTENGGRVRLTVQRHGSEVTVSVRDNGIGIPEHMLPHVFDMFTQVDRNLERSQGGLGIGLSIVKRLVEMHGGIVGAKSDGHGMGSEFTVRLPVVLSIVQPLSEGAASSRQSTRRKILVVDDNRDSAMSLAMMLDLMGNESKTAHDGIEALEVAAAFRPDLMLLDIGMPRLNGYDTAKEIRKQPWGGRIVLIALTGWGQDEDRRKSVEAGFDAHLVKPIEPQALEKLLDNLRAETG